MSLGYLLQGVAWAQSLESGDRQSAFTKRGDINEKIQFTLLWLLLSFPSFTLSNDSASAIIISKPEEFQEAFTSVPCKNKERMQEVKALFLKMGAPESDITIEKIKDVENIVLRKQGETDEKIIIGAHYDFTGAGSCGAIDNWTGIVVVAHLFKSLKNARLKKTLLFVGFGKEEQGLIGSKAMAKQIKKEERNQYCAMVNLDSLGLNTPQVLNNVSSPKLESAANALAKKMNIAYQSFEMGTALSDSVAFIDQNIPAITFSAITNDWKDILHHKADQALKVNPVSVYLGYRLTLAIVAQINESPCESYR